jgi:hypothetical protein
VLFGLSTLANPFLHLQQYSEVVRSMKVGLLHGQGSLWSPSAFKKRRGLTIAQRFYRIKRQLSGERERDYIYTREGAA